MKDAIRASDLAYAETTLDRYLDYLRAAPNGMRFGSVDALDLKLYLVAGRKDVTGTLRLLDERMAVLTGRDPCFYGGVLFPMSWPQSRRCRRSQRGSRSCNARPG